VPLLGCGTGNPVTVAMMAAACTWLERAACTQRGAGAVPALRHCGAAAARARERAQV
jgi:hypothetical protein